MRTNHRGTNHRGSNHRGLNHLTPIRLFVLGLLFAAASTAPLPAQTWAPTEGEEPPVVEAGALSGFGADGSFTYTPDPNFGGEDSFTYEAIDGVSGATAQATRQPVTA